MTDTKPAILAAGLPVRLRARLQGRLKDATLESVQTAQEGILKLKGAPFALVVIDQSLKPDSGMEFLADIRHFYSGEVVFCCGPEAKAQNVLTRLVRHHRVSRVLFQPVDPDELCRVVAMLLGLRMPGVAMVSPAPTAAAEMLGGVWKKFEQTNRDRVAAVRRAVQSACDGGLEPETRRQAEREAHQLAGSMGTFGLPGASLLARELENALSGTRPLDRDEALRLAELARRLEADVDRHGQATAVLPVSSQDGERALLVVSDDGPLTADLVALPGTFKVQVTPHPSDVRQALARVSSGAVVVDLPPDEEATRERLALLQELGARAPHLVLVALIPEESLEWRVRAAETADRLVLARPVTAGQLVETVEERLSGLLTESRVLAVDDDPVVLASLEVLLKPLNYRLTTLNDPLEFWERLEIVAPDLLILDIDMPHVSGIELCRAVRSDPRWADLPIMFLSAYNDSAMVHRIFQAGADDFVFKPIVGPELITRIGNRLSRTRLYRAAADVDALTGAMTRRRGSEALRHHLALARRRGTPLSVAVLDLDHFKQVNDRFGHPTGDQVLRRVARLLQESVRGEDMVIRWGGEEFVVALYTMPREGAGRRLEDVLSRLSQEVFTGPSGEPFHVTFSAGVAQFPDDGQDLPTLVDVADRALYQAKAGGRNQVVLAGAPSHRESRKTELVLVEDDHPLAEAIVGAAESRGFRVDWFARAEEALHALGGVRPLLSTRVLVVDQDLPGMSGLDLLRGLREVSPRPKVVLLSGKMQEREVLEGLDLGAVDYVAKPFHLSVLIRKLERLLEVA
ncbi:MAG: response regulator [Candidatus Eremiobacterota bacterium]